MSEKSLTKKPLVQVGTVRELLVNNQAKNQLAAVAARHMSPERLMRVTANAIRTTPRLQNCEPLSFLGALMQCAALGLEPNTVMGHAYLVPFNKSVKDEKGRWIKIPQVQLIIGYKGYKALAWRSGTVEAMHADVVYSDDEDWSYSYGTDMHLRHKPGSQEGEKTHAYCYVKFRDGGHAFAVLPWAHVMRVRNNSQNWQTAVRNGKEKDSPWFTHEDAMAAKTAVRYVFQRGDVPMSTDIATAMEIDHDSGARLDFSAFALDPESGGPLIDGTADDQDDDGNDQDDGKTGDVVDDTDKTGDKVEPKQEPKEDAKPEQKDDAKGAAAKTEDDYPVLVDIRNTLTDGAPIDAAMSFYADQIDRLDDQGRKFLEEIKKEFPDQ